MPVPSAVELGRDIQKLRGLIDIGETEMIEVLGQGRTVGREFDTPEGKMFVGWYRLRDEQGSLVWGNLAEVKKGIYHALYVYPYPNPPEIDLISVTDKGSRSIALPWSAVHGLLSLLNPQEA